MISYKGDLEERSTKSIEKIVERVCKKFSFREIDLENFRQYMKLYTKLSNELLKNYKFYYKREVQVSCRW
jgi:hypothetical protein